LCRKMDRDSGGYLDLDEIRHGYRTYREFGDTMKVLGIMEEDLGRVFDLMDLDGSGTVTAEEFCKECVNLQCQDTASVSLYLRMFVTQLNKRVEELIHDSKKQMTYVHEEMGGMQKAIHEEVTMVSDKVVGRLMGLPDASVSLGSRLSGEAPDSTLQSAIEARIQGVTDLRVPMKANMLSQKAAVTDALCISKLASVESAISELMDSIQAEPTAIASTEEVQRVIRSAVSLLQLSTDAPARSRFISSVSAKAGAATPNGGNHLGGVDKGLRFSI